MKRFGVVIFPGSNCDYDVKQALATFDEIEVVELWHKEPITTELDAIILPGGFTYGDYLRCGAMARFSPVMESVSTFAKAGGLVMGICNGFQILTEAGLLPGALLQNQGLKFLCRDVFLRVENNTSPFTCRLQQGETLRIPIAHYEGNFFADEPTLASLEKSGTVGVRYCSPDGSLDEAWNPNGSLRSIAGIFNEKMNVFGLMPHPERVVESLVGGEDGRKIFDSMLAWLDA